MKVCGCEHHQKEPRPHISTSRSSVSTSRNRQRTTRDTYSIPSRRLTMVVSQSIASYSRQVTQSEQELGSVIQSQTKSNDHFFISPACDRRSSNSATCHEVDLATSVYQDCQLDNHVSRKSRDVRGTAHSPCVAEGIQTDPMCAFSDEQASSSVLNWRVHELMQSQALESVPLTVCERSAYRLGYWVASLKCLGPGTFRSPAMTFK